MNPRLNMRTMIAATAIAIGCVQSDAAASEGRDLPSNTRVLSTNSETAWSGFGHSRNWQHRLDITKKPFLQLDWKMDVGEGYSQIIGSGSRIFVASGSAKKTEGKNSRVIETVLSARSADAGDEVWSYQSESNMSDDQQTFGGVTPTPRATPLLIAGRVIYWTFTGELICLNADSGKLVWQKVPVTELAAQKVQFGFSASPVACPDDSGDFIVLAAGERGGLLRVSAATGEIRWISPIATFSYATPVFARIGDVAQWIGVSRDDVIGIDHETGKSLWSVKLRETGLTNVPTPLVLDASTILISGQGTKGTQCLEILRQGDQWVTKQRWENRTQFFYTNWLKLNEGIVVGCTDKFLTGFDCLTGNQLGRWRGYADGNLLQLGDHYALVSGKGELSVMSFNRHAGEFVIERQHSIGEGRFWTAPSVVGNRLFVRFAKQLHCYRFTGQESDRVIMNRIDDNNRPRLAFESVAEADPVEAVFTEFEKNGQQAALALYTRLREGRKLSAEHRIAIAEAAWKQGLRPLAYLIIRHAQADLPDSQLVEKKLAEWTQ